MKYFKFKHVALMFTATMLFSCSTTDIVEEKNLDLSDSSGYTELFKEYENFIIDGKEVTDQREVAKALKTSFDVEYIPAKKKIVLYTTESISKRMNPKPKPIFDTDSSYASRMSTDLGEYNQSYLGFTNLGYALDQQYYRDFSQKVYIIINSNAADRVNGSFLFYRVNGDVAMNNTEELLLVDTSGVINNYQTTNTSDIFKAVNDGVQWAIMRNDASSSKSIVFYENESAGGKSITYTLTANQATKILKDAFSAFSLSKPRSCILN